MSLTFTTAQAVLKEDYKALKKQLNDANFILSQVEKNTDDVVGRRAYHALHITRNSGVGARGDGGTLPTAGNQGYINALVPMRFNYGRIQINGTIIHAMAKDRGSFIRAVRSEMDGIAADLKRDRSRQVWGTSDGVIAACGTTSSSTTVQLAATTSDTQIRQLWADGGMRVDLGTVASPTSVASDRAVTGYDLANKTITISGAAVTTSGTTRVFRAGNGGASDNSGDVGDGQFELTGLQHIIEDTGVLHGVDPSSYPVWKAGVYDNGGTDRSVSENLVNKAIQDQATESGVTIDLLVGGAGISRAVANTQTAIRRNVDNVNLKAGYSGIAWSAPLEGMGNSKQIALCWDRDAPAGELYGIATDALVNYELSDWDWMDEDGAVLSRVSGVHAYEATYYRLDELATDQRNAHFVIEDLTEA